MTKGTFQPTADYDGEIEAITDLVFNFPKNCPFATPGAQRDWLRNEIKIIAGVHGNRWPSEIYGACVVAGLEDAERSRSLA